MSLINRALINYFIINTFFFASILNLNGQNLKLGIPIGHSTGVWNSSFNSDGTLILTFSTGGANAKVWDVSTGKLLHTLDAGDGYCSSANFSPDGKKIVTTSIYGDSTATDKIKVWDPSTGKQLFSIPGDVSGSELAVFSPNGKWIATVGKNEIELWDAENGNLIRNYKGHTASTMSVAFSPDSRYILAGSWDGTYRLWETESGQLLFNLGESQYSVESLHAVFSPDGQFFLTMEDKGYDGKIIKKWKISTKEVVSQFEAVEPMLNWNFSLDGTKIIAADVAKAKVWNADNGQLLQEVYAGDYNCTSANFSPDADVFVTISEEENIAKVWDTENGDLLHIIEGHGDIVRSSNFSPDGRLLVTTADDGSVRIWRTSDWKLLHSLGGQINSLFLAVFSPDGKEVIFTNSEYFLGAIDISTGQILYHTKAHSDYITDFNINNKNIITASRDESAKVWDIKSGQLMHHLEGHSDEINSASFSPNNEFIQTSSDDGSVNLWSASSGKLLHNLKGHYSYEPSVYGGYSYEKKTAKVIDAAFTTDSKRIFTASSDLIKIWDVNSGALTDSLESETFESFNKTANLFCTRPSKDVVNVWDITSGRLLNSFNLKRSAAAPTYLVYSPDKTIMVSSSGYLPSKIFKTNKREPQHIYDENFEEIHFSNDSKSILTIQGDKTAKKLDLHKDNILMNLEGHQGILNSARYSPDKDKIVTSSDDGSLIIWDAITGKHIIQHFILENDPSKWIHLTEEGYFDASPEAMKLMYWIKGREIIEFTQLKDRFWIPGLWETVMEGKSLPGLNSRGGLNDINLYPKIKLTDPLENNGKLGIVLINQGGGYGPVKVLINKKEVSSDVRGKQLDQSTDSIKLDYKIANHPYLKAGEINTIEVSAYNSEEYIVSQPKKIYYIAEGTKEDYQPTLHAIIVGTADYVGQELDLRYPAKDAMAFSSALELAGKNLLGIAKTNFKILTTDGDEASKPSKFNIEKAYLEIAKTAKPYDILVLYFAGHGTNYGGAEGDFYYLTADAGSGNLKDPVIRENSTVSSKELTAWIKDIPALKQVLIFDACHSGQFAEDLLTKRNLRNSNEIKSLERMKDRTGMYILSGSAADAVSYEASIYGQGLLTYSLLFGMKGASLRENKFIDVVGLFQFAANNVPELAKNIGGIQKPEIRIPLGGESFDIGILDSKDREKINLPSPKPLFVRSSFQNQVTFDDNLELSELMNEQLRNMENGNENKIVFINAGKFTNAYSIRGQYLMEDGTIKLEANLIKNGQVINSYSFDGSSKEELVAKLINISLDSVQ